MLSEINQQWVAQEFVSAARRQFDAADAALDVEREHLRPFYLLKPRIFPDGNQWCVLYGENLQEGVAGFGDTPAHAAVQFDIEFLNSKILKQCQEGKQP